MVKKLENKYEVSSNLLHSQAKRKVTSHPESTPSTTQFQLAYCYTDLSVVCLERGRERIYNELVQIQVYNLWDLLFKPET